MIRFSTRAAAFAALFLFAACDAPGRNVPIEFLTFDGNTMGTTYSVRVAKPPQEFAGFPEKLARIIEAELDHVNDHMSTYQDDSELSKFNAYRDAEPFPLSEDVATVLEKSLQVCEETGGAFDITVGPLVNAWGFGPEGRLENPPDDATIAALKERVGYTHVELDADSATKKIPNLYCDLSAIAKGWAADQVAQALREAGCENFMAEIGGEVQTAGVNADGVPWRIAIETPAEDRRAVFAIAGLSGAAMATSGEYRNFYNDAGIRISHTIDPRTGKPIAHNLGSVSVIHEECAMADAYATALNVMGPEAGFTWAEEHGLAAFFVVRDNDGTLKHRATDACAPYSIEVVYEADNAP